MITQRVGLENAPPLVENLVSDALSYMERVGYGKSSKTFHGDVWKKLIGFARQNGCAVFTEELAQSFLESLHKSRTTQKASERNPYPREGCSIRMLAEFSLHGCWCQRSREKDKYPIPESFSVVLDKFIFYQHEVANNRTSTLEANKIYLRRFLHYLDVNGLSALRELRPDLISGFLSSLIHLKPHSLRIMAGQFKKFLRYLWITEITPEDMSLRVPKINVPCEPHLPSFWDREKLDALLAVVDRGSPVGKRDYAILLLACRLGMRASDIRALRLENIQWEKYRIFIEQVKTARPLTLPLTAEVGDALIDYLKHGRPPVTCREVFLRSLAPFQPFAKQCSFNGVISSYRRKAGIPLRAAGGMGLHSLRHTVAFRLLEVDTPLETIAGILGHASLETTRLYTRVDISTLRGAALDPEEAPYA